MGFISHSPTGRLVNVDSHTLHINICGDGSPTVVLETGGASWSMDWLPVQAEVAKFTRVCSYDRAGFGWSEPGLKPRSSGRIVLELHDLLTSAQIEAPYLVVGASFGGHIARLFAHQYPSEIAGLILLDARHEDLAVKMPPAWKKLETTGKRMNQFLLWASRAGLLQRMGKMLGHKVAPPMLSKLPPEMHSVYLEVGFQPHFFQSNLDELEAAGESDAQVRVARSLGDIPLTVVRHGVPDLFAGMPRAQAEQAEFVWQELQADLVNLSTNSRMLIAEKCGHRIQMDDPDLVIEAIRQMVNLVR